MSNIGRRCSNCGQVNSMKQSVCIYCKKGSGLNNAEILEYRKSAFTLKNGDYVESNTVKEKGLPVNNEKIIIESYKGNIADATSKYEKRAQILATKGFIPKTQSYQQGRWSFGDFLVAIVFCVVIIGFLAIIYMLIVKPTGALTVTYEYKKELLNTENIEEKQCPDCAETVKKEARKCRFCGFEF